MEKHLCALCGIEFVGFGHNPEPLSNTGRACDRCNDERVIPARLQQAVEESDGSE